MTMEGLGVLWYIRVNQAKDESITIFSQKRQGTYSRIVLLLLFGHCRNIWTRYVGKTPCDIHTFDWRREAVQETAIWALILPSHYAWRQCLPQMEHVSTNVLFFALPWRFKFGKPCWSALTLHGCAENGHGRIRVAPLWIMADIGSTEGNEVASPGITLFNFWGVAW